MENKYKGVFGFGTPDIRPCKRMKNMDQNQIKSQIHLRRMCGEGMAGGPSNQNDERDSNNFRKVSASDFLKRTRAAELEFKSKIVEKEERKEEVKKAPVQKSSLNKKLLNFE